jgi:acetyl esterase/lipase
MHQADHFSPHAPRSLLLTGLLLACVSGQHLDAQDQPTHANVAYGADERNVMDVWLAEGDSPRPCVMLIHGGGWLGGDKNQARGGLETYLAAGISVAAINYRYVKQTIVDSGNTRGTGPILERGDYPIAPVKAPLDDAARALQFIRLNAAAWNIDPVRIAVTGGSAGGASSLWLNYHDDMANPDATDPVERESTKPFCAAVNGGQSSFDPKDLLEWCPNQTYGGHAFGFIWDHSDHTVEIRSFLAHRDEVLPWIQEYSPCALVSADDPPVYLLYPSDVPGKGSEPKDPVHSANYGAMLIEKLDPLGLKYEFVHQGTQDPVHKDIPSYLIAALHGELW